eukprot:1385684-Alexandrium_andersonii.AAC.1
MAKEVGAPVEGAVRLVCLSRATAGSGWCVHDVARAIVRKAGSGFVGNLHIPAPKGRPTVPLRSAI